ncbi:MAG: hypothetical protein ABSH09_00380 [Bryobacteraceae bacterium]|jgi:ABC-2 type transport system permease protein
MFNLASPHARAILWAQFRGMRNSLPRSNKLGLAFTIIVGVIWYGIFTIVALGAAALMSRQSEMATIARILPGGLMLVYLYWLALPMLLASKGSSLELSKLLVYPIPPAEFFLLEMLLRLSSGIEPLILVMGAFIGLCLNRAVPAWAPASLIIFLLFTVFSVTALHDVIGRLMMRKGVREIVGLLFVLVVALPQLVLTRGNPSHLIRAGQITSWSGWPWTAAALLAEGQGRPVNFAVLLAWLAAAYVFGRRQFERTLTFDASAARSTRRIKTARGMEWFYRWPNMLFRDPIAALVEKELRFLSRASRFRMVFVMGFSFGLIIWWPMAFGHQQHSWMDANFITIVSLYAVLLLSDVLFWNAFGFDRQAAQFYFAAPVRLRTVLLAKNIAAGFFVLLETTIAILVCALLRLPVTPLHIGEAYAATFVASLLLLGIGNLTSFYSPRAVDPARALRSARSGRIQGLMLVVYPVVALPLFLAYAARYAFDSEAAFFGVLAIAAIFAAIAYKVAMDSAVEMAETKKESILSALSQGQGPVE